MGIRKDQLIGFTDAATVFLEEHEIPLAVCPHCNRPFPPPLEVIGYYTGIFDDQYPLHRHVLNDGRTVDEFLQIQPAPWFLAPVHFLGLQVSDGAQFLWTEEEIEALSN